MNKPVHLKASSINLIRQSVMEREDEELQCLTRDEVIALTRGRGHRRLSSTSTSGDKAGMVDLEGGTGAFPFGDAHIEHVQARTWAGQASDFCLMHTCCLQCQCDEPARRLYFSRSLLPGCFHSPAGYNGAGNAPRPTIRAVGF